MRLLLVGLAASMLLAADDLGAQRDRIRAEIAKASTCKVKADCAGPLYRCPFGCSIYVNRNELERIKKLLASYPEECDYECKKIDGFDCVEGKCAAVLAKK